MNDTNTGLTPNLVEKLSGDAKALARVLAVTHVADVIEALNTLAPEKAAEVLSHMTLESGIHVFNNPGVNGPARLIELLPIERACALASGIYPDRRAEIFRNLSDDVRERLFQHLDPATSASLTQLLSYPPMSAGGIMTTEFVSMPATWTIEQGLRHIRDVGGSKETIYAIYVLEPDTQRLLQAISLRQLVIADPKATVLSIAMPRKPITVSPLTDREDVARLISKYDLLAVPVVGDQARVLGIVTVDDVIDAMIAETTEDTQKFGGMEALDQPYMRIDFITMIRKRAGWLSALFLSEMLTASAMQHFQGELEKAVVLTLFIPLIMSSGGNSGSQATSLIIRALALRELKLRDWFTVALRELPAGLVLGAILGVIGVVRIALWQKLGIFNYGPYWYLVALTVGGALVGIVTFGSLVGSMLPFILKRLKFDPASASAPFVATLVDVTGLVIYFSVAYVFLKGTLL